MSNRERGIRIVGRLVDGEGKKTGGVLVCITDKEGRERLGRWTVTLPVEKGENGTEPAA